MGTKSFNNYADLITFSRASGGTALRPVSYGSELVTNGDGSDTTGWVAVAASFSSDGSVFTVTDTDGSIGYVDRLTSGFTSGSVYQVSIDVTTDVVTPSGRFYLQVGTSSGVGQLVDLQLDSVLSPSGTGTATAIFIATSTSHYVGVRNEDVSAGQSWSFDNISVKEVLFDQPDGTLTLFNHPDNIPRIEYDANGNRLGLLIEEQRTNLYPDSEDFSNWDLSGVVTITPDASLAPDGTTTSTKITSAASSTGLIYKNFSVVSGTVYTQSLYAKAGEFTHVQFGLWNGFTSSRVNFNLLSGTVGTNDTGGVAVIEDVGNGIYRCSLSVTATATRADGRIFYKAANSDAEARAAAIGDGTSGIYVWGAQIEEGSFPTSYIPTSGSTATRAADVASIPVSDFGYNQNQGTVFFEVINNNSGRVGALGDGTFTNDLRFGVSGSSICRGTGGGFVNAVTTGSYTDQSKLSVGIELDNYSSAADNVGAGVNDTSASLPPNPVNLYIGQDYGAKLNGHIKSLKYYPRRLTNDQLQELTA